MTNFVNLQLILHKIYKFKIDDLRQVLNFLAHEKQLEILT